MEINQYQYETDIEVGFKIDLIVWKLYYGVQLLYRGKMFKIDLIVWKLYRQTVSKKEDREFKIDLIVWKFCSYYILIAT